MSEQVDDSRRIVFPCPGCRTKLKAKPEQAGKRYRCPKCQTEVTVPARTEQNREISQAVSMVEPASRAETVSPAETRDGRGDTAPEDKVPEVWQPGDVILDLYEVKEVLGEGGFGKVYRVHHRGWNLDLAVKSPLPGRFRTERDKEKFVRECETWVNLGLHPHTVSCYYVRILGGIPRVFAEYVEGGNLKEWIEQGKTIELQTVLDIAIQIAWGMAYAHSKGLVHRDLKPANILLTPDGTAKVTDFGLARQGTAMGEDVETSGYQVSSGAGTPGYGAPEQWSRGATVDHRADIFAFGVMLWKMLSGAITWADEGRKSVIARHAVTELLKRGEPKGLPEPLVELILRCLEPEPEDRWPDFTAMTGALQRLYEQHAGDAYARVRPEEAELVADILNNRALSLLDLGKTEEAVAAWQQALASDVQHLESVYNLGLLRWRTGQIDDVALVRSVREADCRGEPWRAAILAAQVEIESGDCEAALRIMEELELQDAQRPEAQGLQALAQQLLPNSRRCLRTIEGGASYVSLSGDARCALSGSHDNTLKWREVASGQCLRTFEGHTEGGTSVSLSADGRYALLGSHDTTLKLWDISSGQCLRTFKGHANSVTSVCLNSDGCYAVSGSCDNTLKWWEVASGRCLQTFKGHTAAVNSVCLSADGRYALSGSADSTLKLWDLNGWCVRTFEGHTDEVTSVCLSVDGRYALSGSGNISRRNDRTLKLWEVSSGRCLQTFEGHTAGVQSVWFSADGHYALSGSADRTLKLWTVPGGRCLRTFEGHTLGVTSVCGSEEGRYALSASRDGILKVWEVRGNYLPQATWEQSRLVSSEDAAAMETQFQQTLVEAERVCKRGKITQAAAMIREARGQPGYRRHPAAIKAWQSLYCTLPKRSLAGAWALQTFEGHTGNVNSVCLSADGRYALSGSQDKTLKLWEVTSGLCLRTFEGHTAEVCSVCISADGRYALSGSLDTTLKLWEVTNGLCLRTFEGHSGYVNSVCLSADGRYALSGSDDTTLKLWDISGGQCLRTFKGHASYVTSVCLSADGCYAVSGSHDNTLKWWEVASGRVQRTFEGHKGWFNSVCLSADSRYALSGSSWTKTLQLWEVASGQCQRTIEGHADDVFSVCISTDGRYALSGGNDKMLKLWELSSGRCLREFDGYAEQVDSVWLSTDSRYVLSGSGKMLRLWALDWELKDEHPADWDEGARPYVEIFLTQQTPYARSLFKRMPTLTRRSKPVWTEEDFQRLLATLGYAGYGWLRPEGVRRKLEEMAANWTGPPPLPG